MGPRVGRGVGRRVETGGPGAVAGVGFHVEYSVGVGGGLGV